MLGGSIFGDGGDSEVAYNPRENLSERSDGEDSEEEADERMKQLDSEFANFMDDFDN